jgi:hypothetical protein
MGKSLLHFEGRNGCAIGLSAGCQGLCCTEKTDHCGKKKGSHGLCIVEVNMLVMVVAIVVCY